MSVFASRGHEQHVRVGYSFLDSAYSTKVGWRYILYLRLQRYVWRSLKGRLGPLYKNGLLVSRATRGKLVKTMGVSHDTVDRGLAWLVKEGWLQKTYHQKRLHFLLGKWSTGAKTGKVKEMYLADQVIQAHIQTEQAQAAADVVAGLAEPANAPQHPQTCGVTTPKNAPQHPQGCGLPVRMGADTPSAPVRMMNREEKNREKGIEKLPYGKGSARCASQPKSPRVQPSAVSLHARSAHDPNEQKPTSEKENDQNEYTAPDTFTVSDVSEQFVCVSVPVESPIEDGMAETPEQKAERMGRAAGAKGAPKGEIVPADKFAPPTKAAVDAYGDEKTKVPATRPGKAPKGLKGELRAYANTQVPDPDTIDRAPSSTLGFAKFVETVIKKHFPTAVVRPDNVDLKWCKELLDQFTTEELYEMTLLLTMDWTNINHSKEFFPPGGDHPLIKDLFRHRKLLATFIGKGFVVFPNYRTSAYQPDYARRHGVSVTDTGHVVTEEDRLKRIREQMRKQAGE